MSDGRRSKKRKFYGRSAGGRPSRPASGASRQPLPLESSGEGLFVQVEASDDHLTCQSCNKTLIPGLSSFFNLLGGLSPCHYCVTCFSRAQSTAPFSFDCSCGIRHRSFTVNDVSFSTRGRGGNARTVGKRSSSSMDIPTPDRRLDPIRHFKDSASNHKDCAVLAFAGVDNKGHNIDLSAVIPTFGDPTSTESAWTTEQKESAAIIFKVLNGILVGTSKWQVYNALKISSHTALTKLALSDNSPLMECIFALSYGELIKDAIPPAWRDEATIGPVWATLLKTVYALTETI